MSELFECGDSGALVAYLYDECEPEVRDTIAAHLGRCLSCSSEIESFGWTRRQLGAWTPPVADLGFQMGVPASELTLPWWRAPLPAWAQAAAAVLIFGAGLSIGAARAPFGADQTASPRASVVPVADTVSRDDLSQMEQRLKAEMTRLRTAAAVPAQASTSDEAIMRRVQALVGESEERQRKEFTIRSVELARDFEAQRRVDLASVRQTVGQLQGTTGAEVRQQREAIDQINNYLIRVSQQGR
jgi:hypothetical protein